MEAELELESNLGGVADMKRQPDAVFVIDLKKEQLAVREAQRLGVPIVRLVDTNADPDEADFVIPGNDDAIRSCNLVARVVADGIEAGKTKVTPAEMAASAPAGGGPAEPEAAADSTPEPETAPEPELEPAAVAEGRKSVSTTISASLVKELRDQTGAGMMDCKRALEETDGDIEAATLLRERGMASAGKRAGRATTEGLVGYIVEERRGSIVGIGCETEPVSKNDGSRASRRTCYARCTSTAPARSRASSRRDSSSSEARREHRRRRRRALRRGGRRRPRGVRASAGEQDRRARAPAGGSPELAEQLAMHIAFAAPEWARATTSRRGGRRRAGDLPELGRGAVEARGGA